MPCLSRALPGQPEAWHDFFFTGPRKTIHHGIIFRPSQASPRHGMFFFSRAEARPGHTPIRNPLWTLPCRPPAGCQGAWHVFFRAARNKKHAMPQQSPAPAARGHGMIFFARPRKIVQHGMVFGPRNKKTCHARKKSMPCPEPCPRPCKGTTSRPHESR